MTIHYRQQGSAIIVFGNTYPVREQIKAAGARWDGALKNWRMPASEANLAFIAGLCKTHGGGALGEASVTTSATVAVVDTTSGVAVAAAVTATAAAPGSMPQIPADTLTVRQVMERAGLAVASAFPQALWITGEVQNLAQRPSGVFFDLAEAREGAHANATVTARAIIWSGALAGIRERRGADKLGEVLQDGMQVRVLCQVQLYRDRGQISLAVEDIDPSFTKGALALAREKLMKELRAKGLDVANKRRPLPPFPFRIGLVSAEGSRAKSDFLDQLFSLGFPGEVVFCATPMQGEKTPLQVTRAVTLLQAKGVDLIVITRGGGSAADLRWFDAPEIAYAIATSPVPVVAAIGHHEDVALAEEICFLRQKTPTAAADYVVSIFAKTREKVDELAAGMARQLGYHVESFAKQTAALSERLAGAAVGSINERSERILCATHDLKLVAQDRIHQSEGRLATAAAALGLGSEKALSERKARLAQATSALALGVNETLSARQAWLGRTAAEIRRRTDETLAERRARLAQAVSAFTLGLEQSMADRRARLAQAASALTLGVQQTLGERQAGLAKAASALTLGVEQTMGDRRASLARVVASFSLGIEQTMGDRRAQVAQATADLSRLAAQATAERRSRLAQATSLLALGAEKSAATQQSKLAALETELVRRDPKPWLVKGWTQLFGKSGQVRSVSQVAPGDELTARVTDGRLGLRVTAATPAAPNETTSGKES